MIYPKISSTRFNSKSPFFYTLMILCFLVTSTASPVTAATSQQTTSGMGTGPTQIFLPLICSVCDLSTPELISPASGDVLDTLIPEFIFTSGVQPTSSIGCLAISTSPHPVSCQIEFYIEALSNDQKDYFMFYNLNPNQTYFWRIGIGSDWNSTNWKWSLERSFIAGPADGEILLAPTLRSPENGSTYRLYSPGGGILTWDAIPGALFYVIMIHDKSTNMWGEWGSDTNTLNEQYCMDCFKPNTTYEWTVQARNHYAWGAVSGKFTFTTTN